jgi:hypothetical protein
LRDAGGNTLLEPEEIPEDIGTVAPNGVTEYDGYLIVYTNEGGSHGVRILLSDHYSQEILGKRAASEFAQIPDHSTVVLHAFFDKIFIGYRLSGTYNNRTAMLKKISGHWGWSRHTINTCFIVTNPNGEVYIFDGGSRKFLKIDSSVHTDDGDTYLSYIKFIPVTGNDRTEEVTIISGELLMESEYKTAIEYDVERTNDAGIAEIWPKNLPLNEWDTANWNVFDPADAASGVAYEDFDVWNVAFDTHCRGKRIDFTLKKEANEEAKYRDLVLTATTRGIK